MGITSEPIFYKRALVPGNLSLKKHVLLIKKTDNPISYNNFHHSKKNLNKGSTGIPGPFAFITPQNYSDKLHILKVTAMHIRTIRLKCDLFSYIFFLTGPKLVDPQLINYF